MEPRAAATLSLEGKVAGVRSSMPSDRATSVERSMRSDDVCAEPRRHREGLSVSEGIEQGTDLSSCMHSAKGTDGDV
jgi:hypothetical protein